MLNALLAVVLAFASIAAVAGPLGQIEELAGPVKLLDQQGKERVAAKGAELKEGDRIVTAEGGRAQVRLSDGGYLSLRPNTELVFKRYVLDESVPAQSSFWVSLLKGGFRSITGLIGRINPAGYRIETETATIGVRGTDHEPYYIPQPKTGDSTLGEPGTYDKLNSGRSFLETPKGLLDLKPGQVGFAPRLDLAPRLLPKAPDFFRDQPVVPKQYLGKGSSGEVPGAKPQASSADVSANGGNPKDDARPATIGLTPTTSILAPSTNVLQPLPAVPVVQVLVARGTEPNTPGSVLVPTDRTSDAAPAGQSAAATTPATDAPGGNAPGNGGGNANGQANAVSGGDAPGVGNGNANGLAAAASAGNAPGNGGGIANGIGNGNAPAAGNGNGNANGLAAAAPAGNAPGNGVGNANGIGNGNATGQANAVSVGNVLGVGNGNANGLAAAAPAGNGLGNGGGNANGIGNANSLTNGGNAPATNTAAALPGQAAPAVANPAGNVPGAPAAANGPVGGVGSGNAAAASAAPASPTVASAPALANPAGNVPGAPAAANGPAGGVGNGNAAAAPSAPAVANVPVSVPAAPAAPAVANVPVPAPAAPVAPAVGNVPAPSNPVGSGAGVPASGNSLPPQAGPKPPPAGAPAAPAGNLSNKKV